MSTLWVVGDSTLSSFDDKYYYPRYGYGTKLGCYLNSKVQVNNLALSGRSSLSFTKEENYKELLAGMKAGDFLIIGFGHNDEKTETGRYTSPIGGRDKKGTFAASLYDNYIKPALDVSCTPILCTPIVRRTATGEWTKQELHITDDAAQFKGGDYSQAVRDLARDLGIVCVDMTEKTKALYEELGPEETIYLHAWPSNKEVSVDNTHTNIWGGRVNAFLVMQELEKAGISGLSENIVNIRADEPLPDKNRYLEKNALYKPVVFSDELADSKNFKDAYGFKGTVFGDVTTLPTESDNYILEEVPGGIHIAVKNNDGKISTVTDGIAMYYKKIPVNVNFTLKAKMTINDYFYNNQVSFGLMVRDDMYIDKKMPDVLGDYVAAAPLNLTYKDQAWSCFARKNSELMQGSVTGRELKPGDTVEVHLFEAAIDLLSYATYLKCEGKDYKSENLLSLSGVYQPKKEMKDSKIPIALTTFLSANPQIKTIVLHLDNDKVGRLCTATLKELLQKDYKIVDDPPPVGKDFNDFLLSYLKIARPKLKRERSDVR